jgi:hypothetical protein
MRRPFCIQAHRIGCDAVRIAVAPDELAKPGENKLVA